MDVGLNWLWQGGAIALATAAVLRLVPRRYTEARYWLVWAACAAVLVLPAIPLLGAAAAPAGGGPSSSNVAIVVVPFAWWTSATVALALWALWAVAYTWRTAAAMLALRDVKRQAREFPADREARLPHWTRLRRTGRRTRLSVSSQVRTAAVLGGGTPVIAITPALIHHLSDADLDRVVIHEWAHVQRRDDVGHLAQLVVRLVAGWHPALWWLERRLHLEREVACDDIAVGITGSAKAYASCLTRLAALPSTNAGRAPALAVVSSTGLGQRVIRILAGRCAPPARGRRVTALAAAVAMLALASFVGRWQFVETVFALPRAPLAAMAGRAGAGMTGAVAIPRPDDVTPPRLTPEAAQSRPTPPDAATAHDPYGASHSKEPVAAPLRAASPLTQEATELPGVVAAGIASAESRSEGTTLSEPTPLPFWNVAADAGKAIGAGSEQAAVAAAGAFSRFGKRVARSF